MPSGVLYCEVGSKSDDCHGDQCQQTYLAGLVSWSNGKCGEDGVAVVTEISAYVKWIDEIEKSVDYHFYQQKHFGIGHDTLANSYGAGGYGPRSFSPFGARRGLSPYYGDRYRKQPISAYGKHSHSRHTIRPYYRKPAYHTYGKSIPYQGNSAVSYQI